MFIEPQRLENNVIDKEWYHKLSSDEQKMVMLDDIDMEDLFGIKEEKSSPQEIIIKEQMLDISSLDEDNSKSLWRPTDFSEYIGQDKLKLILSAYIRGCQAKNRTFPHMLIDGKAGTGKTTIAYIVANKLGKNFVECVATTLKTQQNLVDKIAECNGGILFIDEIHMFNEELANFILPIIEDFQINGKKIKPFTLLACTTEKGSLIKKFKPLVDRFKIQKTLDDYSQSELKTLTNQYKKKMFTQETVNDNILDIISQNCRLTPRIAIRYLESYIFIQCDIKTVLDSYNIIKDGFTSDDIKILELLNENEKPVGLQAIAGYLGTSEENYMYTNEGYLLQKGLITRTPRGRLISNKGIQFLKEIKNEIY